MKKVVLVLSLISVISLVACGNDEIKNNRRILYNAMISEDFVNLPSEWWHYDYGDKVWASVKNKDVIYIGEDITKKGRIL